MIALILAAGASSRMGSPKALLPWGKSTVLEHIVGQIRQAGLEDIVLVSGAHHQQLLPVAQRENVRVCRHPEWEKGMGSSLARGIAYISDHFPEAGAAVVLLSDQPFVTGKYLQKLLKASQAAQACMIASSYGDAAGVPALFPRLFWKKLEELPPGQGAKAFIQNFSKECRVLETDFPLMDIDTPESYQRALAMTDPSTPNTQK